MELKNKISVITGAAKGIGKCIAKELASKGSKVIILDYDKDLGNITKEELLNLGYDVDFIQVDVTNYESLLDAKKNIVGAFGDVDILVVNAGISIKHSIQEISIEEWNNVINLNLNGSFYTVKAFYEQFEKKIHEDDGRIIFISSGSAITGTGGGAHYSASKAGQHGLMRAISKELGKKGVTVNAIAPRVIVTDLFNELYSTEQARQDLMDKIPIGRFGYPQDIASLALFLASKQSSYIHGQIIVVDGGRTY